MRLAVMSDIHGFNLALDAVLRDIDANGPFDQIVVAGDLCEGGPGPAEVIHRLQERAIPAVIGNTDRDLVEGTRDSDAGRWTSRGLGAEGLAYLGALPFELRFSPPGADSPSDELLVVHANPSDLNRHIRPDASPRELGELLGSSEARCIAFGHLHIAYVREFDDRLLVDVSSVGNPKDGDLRCAWAIIAWDGTQHRWQAEIRRIPYPIDETVEQIRASGRPHPERLIAALLRAS